MRREIDDPGPPCRRIRNHTIFNNPVGGARVPLNLHMCRACLNDYVRLATDEQQNYFTDHEEGEEEDEIDDDPPIPDVTNIDNPS